VEAKAGRKTLSLFYHGGEKPISRVLARDPRMGFDYRKPVDNSFIFLFFERTRGIHQAASGAQVREGSLNHFALPRLKHW